MNTKHMVLMFILLGCSCAVYKPVIDTAQVEDMEQYNQDLLECENLSHEHSNTGNTTVAGAGIGAALGAGVGALIGAIFGDAGEGAAFGAVVGGCPRRNGWRRFGGRKVPSNICKLHEWPGL